MALKEALTSPAGGMLGTTVDMMALRCSTRISIRAKNLDCVDDDLYGTFQDNGGYAEVVRLPMARPLARGGVPPRCAFVCRSPTLDPYVRPIP